MNNKNPIHELRLLKGLSQDELAEKVFVTRQAVSRWESNSAKPDADKIISVCDLFKISTDYLLRDEVETDSKQKENYPVMLRFPCRVKRLVLIFSALCILAIILASVFRSRPPKDIHEVFAQGRFTISGQTQMSDRNVTLDMSVLPEEVLSGEMVEFDPGEIVVYEEFNSTLSLQKVWKPYEDLYCFLFRFDYKLAREGSFVSTTYANLEEATYTPTVRLGNSDVATMYKIIPDALQFRGADSDSFAVYIRKDVLEQIEGSFGFLMTGLNLVTYKHKR